MKGWLVLPLQVFIMLVCLVIYGSAWVVWKFYKSGRDLVLGLVALLVLMFD